MNLKSNEPFWLIKNGLLESYPSLKEDVTTEILILGSGITGALMAQQCMEQGLETMLIDRREIANGSSAATTSMLQYEIDLSLSELSDKIGTKGAVASYKACSDAIDILSDLAKSIKSKSGFRKKDSVYFAANKQDMVPLKAEFEVRKEHGFPVKWLNDAELKAKYGLENTFGGILSKQGASFDAFRFTHELLAYNVDRGLGIYDKTEAKEINHHHKGVTVTTNTGQTIKAKKVIYCTGFETTEIIKEKFVDLLSTYAIVGEINEPLEPELSKTLFWNTADPYLYMRTTDDGRILIGGEDEDFVDAAKRDKLLDKKAAKLEKLLRQYFPQVNFTTDFSWAGTFGSTKDGLPYIGTHEDFPNGYFVLGFGGNGITFSVIGMQMFASFLAKQPHPLDEYFKFGR